MVMKVVEKWTHAHSSDLHISIIFFLPKSKHQVQEHALSITQMAKVRTKYCGHLLTREYR